MQTRTVLLVVGAVGLLGACLLGSCLVWGLTLDDEPAQTATSTEPTEATEPTAPTEAPARAGRYQCQATGMFNSCVGPNRCMFRTASGYGSGDDRFQAAEMARLACQGQVMAMGGSAVCVVTCTPDG